MTVFDRAMLTIQNAGPLITEVSASHLASRLSEVQPDQFRDLGIIVTGLPIGVFVTDQSRSLGSFHIDSKQGGGIAIFDNSGADFELRVRARSLGSENTIVFLEMAGVVSLHDIFLRSSRQTFLWGGGATAVEAFFEMAGDDRSILVGDDCMLSSGIGVRNHDMHTIYSLDDDLILNGEPENITIQQHVWIGQDSLLISPGRIGYGSIVGAKSFVNNEVPSTCIAAGSPARTIRSNASWSRFVSRVDEQTKSRIERCRAASAASFGGL